EVESYNPNAQIAGEGSLGDALFGILSGPVAVHRGPQTSVTLDEGEIFGRMLLVGPAARSATAPSMPGTCVVRLPRDGRRDMITEDPTVASILLVQVVKTLSERLRRANAMLSSVDLLADWLAGSMV